MKVRQRPPMIDALESKSEQQIITPTGTKTAHKGDYIVTDEKGDKEVYTRQQFSEEFFVEFEK